MPETPTPPPLSSDALLRAIGAAALLVDAKGITQWASADCEKVLGLRPRDLVGQPFHILGPPLDGEAIWDMEGDRLHPLSEPWTGAMILNLGEGDHSVALCLAPLSGDQFLLEVRPENSPAGMSEGQNHLQRLASLGRLAGAFAHDYNNVLVGLHGGVSLLKLQTGIDEDLIDILERSSERAQDLTRQLLSLAQCTSQRCSEIEINHLISETMKPLRPITRLRAKVLLPQGGEIPRVMTDPVSVRQILINLVLNAVEAIPERGEIRITTSIKPPGSTELNSQKALAISVQDDGTGIADADRAGIFDAAHSTRGEGRGIGLASSLSLARRLGGDLTFESEAGKGSRFTLWLPLSPCPESQPSTVSVVSTCPTDQSRVILLVDDEEMVRLMGFRMIDKLGHTPLVAASGDQALKIVTRDPSRVDMVILDMVMPGMNGRELLHSLKKVQPSLLAILSSGYLETVTLETLESDGFDAFLQKPYRLEALAEIIEKVLNK